MARIARPIMVTHLASDAAASQVRLQPAHRQCESQAFRIAMLKDIALFWHLRPTLSCVGQVITVKFLTMQLIPKEFDCAQFASSCLSHAYSKIFPEFMVCYFWLRISDYASASFPIWSRGTKAFQGAFAMGAEIITNIIPVCQCGGSCM